jgi:hypothetical protein
MTDINKNRNFVKDSLNLVIDIQTGAVLASSPSITASNAMMMFYPNLKILRLPTQILSVAQRYTDYDFNDISQTYVSLVPLSGVLEKVDENSHILTDEFKKLRSETIIRVNYLYRLECQCLNETGKVLDYAGMPLLMPWLIDQLNRCDPDKGIYTNSIRELADYRDIPEDACYHDFRMRVDSLGMLMSNNYVIFLRYSEMMSKEDADPEKLQKILNTAYDDLRHSTMI